MMMTMIKMKTNDDNDDDDKRQWSESRLLHFPKYWCSPHPPWHSSYFDDKDDNGKMTMTKRQ